MVLGAKPRDRDIGSVCLHFSAQSVAELHIRLKPDACVMCYCIDQGLCIPQMLAVSRPQRPSKRAHDSLAGRASQQFFSPNDLSHLPVSMLAQASRGYAPKSLIALRFGCELAK